MSDLMTEHDVLVELKRAVDASPSQRAFAFSAGISPAYLHAVLNEKRPVGAKILAALHLEKIICYAPRNND